MSMEPKEYIEKQTIERLNAENPSAKDLADGILGLYMRLWSKEDLVELIKNTHQALCTNCPKAENESSNWYQKVIWALVTAVAGALGYFIKQ